MKALILITICGASVVLLLAFSARAVFGLADGHPTAYGTWLRDMFMRDPFMAVIAALAVLFLLTSWIWDPDKNDANDWWWRR